MYCPVCRGEYRPGFYRCKDCDVTLVEKLPPQDEPAFDELVEVLSTADVGQIAVIKSILEAQEIPYVAQGENFNSARNIAVRFLVPTSCFEEARNLLIDFL